MTEEWRPWSAEATQESLLRYMKRRILDGDHPITAWREQRCFRGHKLSKLTGIDRACLEELEYERAKPTDHELERLSKALQAPIHLLVAPHEGASETEEPEVDIPAE